MLDAPVWRGIALSPATRRSLARPVIITLGRTSGQRCWSEAWTDSRQAQAWRGAEPGCGQDPANRSLADAVAQAQEFTLDAPCPHRGFCLASYWTSF
jgi:hypothetical protein